MGGITKRALVLLATTVASALAGQATIASAGAEQTLTVAPSGVPQTSNCYPFGLGGLEDETWKPYMGFVYKDLPAFQLRTGDTLAFDTASMNDADVQLQVELAPTTTNGGDTPAASYTTVVTNTQTPANPRGDTTVLNFELRFTAQAPFNFSGGGLIIRFSNPSATYAMDNFCDGVSVGAGSNDASGKFVSRFYGDADGLPTYDHVDLGDIGAFQLRLADVPTATPGVKKKCKKKKKKKGKSLAAAAAKKKKKCKKKKKK